ncbi:indolepyruvate ferredoxin oxidoreductase family protein [Paucibacter soli]|uniref:indolepyruvate ferredoxin oxidoreductase family protein n=1 Tax=Paucibacter soli TaxID=3133433 RepID=UPI0030A9B3FC
MNAPREQVSLDDKYLVQEGWIYLTGTQALTRLPLQQRQRDSAAGLNTGGYISGYRGSPLGRYDMELWSQAKLLQAANIKFQPAVNEDLAVTAIWGSQYLGVLPGAKVDGVFGIWYGKGPGTDRSGDAFRHVGVAGTGKFGGALALAGDDHGCKSSTIYNFSDPIFIAAGMPVLYPSNTQELLDFGLHGLAMSRFSGCWVGMKVHNDVVEGGGSVYVAPDSPAIVLPDVKPAAHLGPQGFNARVLDLPLMGEERLYHHKLPAVLDYVRANQLNRVMLDAPRARLGVLSAGKSYQDVMQALAELGVDAARAEALGLRVGKLGLVWPLETQFIAEFAAGLEAILVVEEKRPLIEEQLKAILYDLPQADKPRIIGKYDGANQYAPERGASVLQGWGELSPPLIARVLVDALRRLDPACPLTLPEQAASKLPPGLPNPAAPTRNPGFCSGCPHNRSTKVPDGSRAMIGIGCHGMAALNDPLKTPPMFTQMGAEGMHWLGQHCFTHEQHVFVNMGDGTYFHSGFLAIRQALAAKATMTYKILVNGFVSMTGGQPIDGELSVKQIVTELRAEGVRDIVVLSDDVARHAQSDMGVPVLDRRELEAQMERMRRVPGLTVIVYDQACATERRRLRKRGKWVDPAKRSFINAAVCEGCGDCSKASNCLSVEPLETPFGRKRQINQSSCNKDFSCLDGFCPSFVSVHGGQLRKAKTASGSAAGQAFPALAEPTLPALSRDFSVLITGVGGTGVVTIGQVLGMAAHLDGLACSVLDVTGLAQKYGAVMSHVRLAPDATQLHASRIAAGEADTLIGCDLVVSAGDEALARVRAGRSHVFVATDLVPTSEFSRNPDWQMDAGALLGRIRARCGADEQLFAVDGLRIAKALMGDAIAANMFMLGAAWQRGRVPVSHAALMRAIELNKVQIDFNKAAFLWGRRAAQDLAAVEEAAAAGSGSIVRFVPRPDMSYAAVLERSVAALTEYQDAAYARRYRSLVERVATAEQGLGLGERLAATVARYYFKLLAHKDEFEVARLYASPQFRQALDAQFEGDYRLRFHVGAWPFGGTDASGKPVKKEVGAWLMPAFRLLARCKGLRGTWLDPFRGNAERQLARQLLAQYEADVEALLAGLSAQTHEHALQIAALPEKIRGYGHVRARHAEAVAAERARLLA